MSGNLIRKETRTGGDYMLFGYGPFDNLEKAQVYEEGVLAREVSYGYDGNGRRIWKRVEEKTGGGASNVLKFVYDEDNVAAEFLKEGVMMANYLFAPGVDEPLMVERAGRSYYYHQDNLHSVVFITDADGDMVNEYSYDSFGNILRADCPGMTLSPPKLCIPNRYAYTGRELEPEIGMYHYRRRTYNPDAGGFTSEDKNVRNKNMYVYVDNNPINYTDPSGMLACLGGCNNCTIPCIGLNSAPACQSCLKDRCICIAKLARNKDREAQMVGECNSSYSKTSFEMCIDEQLGMSAACNAQSWISVSGCCALAWDACAGCGGSFAQCDALFELCN
jgi:RHS repeat-associated protein